jgi:glucokinase
MQKTDHPAIPLTIPPERKMPMKGDNDMVLAIDLGGTKIISAVIDSGESMLARDHSVTPAALGQEAVIEAIGARGPSNPEKGILFTSPNLHGWHNVPIRDIIQGLFDKRTFLINDANAAALREERLL